MTRCHAALLISAIVIGLVQAVGCGKQPGTADTPTADAKAAEPADSATAEAKPSAAPAPSHSLTAQDVLEKMAEAYRSTSTYEDFATAELSEPGSTEPRAVDFQGSL